MCSKIFLFIFFVGCVIAEDLKCQYCRGKDHDSDCRKGTTTETETCTSEYPVCVISVTTKDKDLADVLYYRACGRTTFCEKEKKDYGRNLFYCDTCNGSNCNNAYLFKDTNLTCINCKQDGENSDCELGKMSNTTKCAPSTDYCYAEIVMYGNTRSTFRACARKHFCESETEIFGSRLKTCSVCKESNCNNRSLSRICVKCVGAEDSDCQRGNVTDTEKCLGSECYAQMAQGLATFDKRFYSRGCASEEYCSKATQSGKSIKFCTTCGDKDSCNSQPIKVSTVELSCITCDGVSGPCVSGKEENAVKCSKQQNACFQEYLENDNNVLVKRGCGTDDHCEKERTRYGDKLKRCTLCDSNKCNTKEFEPLKCYSCESSGHGDCAAAGKKLKSTTTCSKVSDVCFHRKYQTEYATYTHRGCADSNFCKKSVDLGCELYYGDLENMKQDL